MSARCPSCGRFVGPYERCPYCGANLAGRLSLRVLKLSALVLTLVGFALLWFVAVRSPIPTLSPHEIERTMNLAYVRVEGLVTKGPSYDPETTYLSFRLEDDGGQVQVIAYASETRALLEAGSLPGLGDWVAAVGTLRIREGTPTLILDAPHRLAITRPEPHLRAVAEIGPQDAFRRVTVRGQVRGNRQPYAGLTLLRLRDATGEIEVAIPDDVTALTGPLEMPSIGQAVQVTGTVTLYRDRPQISLTDATEMTSLKEPVPIAQPIPIAGLGNWVGRWVEVRGQVRRLSPFSAGLKVTLEDSTGQATLLLWQSVYEALTDLGAWQEGATVVARGEVNRYRGEMEVVPELADDVRVVAPPEEQPPLSPGDLSIALLGRTVEVEGVLGERRSFSRGVTFRLQGGGGTVVLLLWQEVYQALPDPKALRPGVRVRVRGKLDRYRGELELIPRQSHDVQIISEP